MAASVAILAAGAWPVLADPYGTFLRWPLSTPPGQLRGGFGEPRAGHFHAGLDISTGGHVGAEVLAPGTGYLERVRTSGAGYGRSLYLRVGERQLVFGHLDAFAPEVAAYADSAQRLTGEYEQDLTPPPGRFRFAAGERIAWSGESGAGPPHLHVEIRHGDFAINPLLAGLAVADTVPPRLESVALEPLDERSWVARSAAPRVLRLPVEPETVVVEGRVRVVVKASDATNLARELPVRTVGARFGAGWAECREDSISWAGDMVQLGWLLDRGRVAGTDGVILDAPANFRPRFLLASAPLSERAEFVSVEPGAPARALEVYARDAAGHETLRRVWLRGPRAGERGPDTTRVGPAARVAAKGKARGKASRARAAARPKARPAAARGSAAVRSAGAGVTTEAVWSFEDLPDQRVRVRVTNTPPGLRDVHIERGGQRPELSLGSPATWDGAGWTAVLDCSSVPEPDGFWFKAQAASGKAWWQRGSYAMWPTGSDLTSRVEDWAWFDIDPGAAYEPGVAMVRTVPITGVPAGGTGIRATVSVQPVDLPVKRAVQMTLILPAGLRPAHTAIYRRDGPGDNWEFVGAEWDSTQRSFQGLSSRMGEFALLRDDAPPEVTPHAAATHAQAGGPYSRWALTAHAADHLSGIDSRASGFTVDGVKVPTEWDAEASVFRWRPLHPPALGAHKYRIEVQDHAGNRTVKSGSFTIVSR